MDFSRRSLLCIILRMDPRVRDAEPRVRWPRTSLLEYSLDEATKSILICGMHYLLRAARWRHAIDESDKYMLNPERSLTLWTKAIISSSFAFGGTLKISPIPRQGRRNESITLVYGSYTRTGQFHSWRNLQEYLPVSEIGHPRWVMAFTDGASLHNSLF